MKFRKLYLFVVITIILFILNPSINRFKEFTAQPEKFYKNKLDERLDRNPITIVRRRTQNYLFFSFFEFGKADSYGKYTPQSRYIGFCFNFFELSNSKENEEEISESILVDTTAARVDTTMR
jgi:hypothetical protein